METYCISCKKNTENKNPSVRRTKPNRLMFVMFAIYGKKKTWMIEQIKDQNSIT